MAKALSELYVSIFSWVLTSQSIRFVGALSSSSRTPPPPSDFASSSSARRSFASMTTTTTTTTPASAGTARHTLYDTPVSNNGARCRIILYKKGIASDQVAIETPAALGGLKTPEFAAINPQRKIPALVRHESEGSALPKLCLGESDTISRYLLSTYADVGPSFLPDHPTSNFVARIHDLYMAPIQGCMYKADPPFGVYGSRYDAMQEYKRQWSIVESLVLNEGGGGGGDYLFGPEVSLADAALFPSAVFARHMLPKFESGALASASALPPTIEQWYQNVLAKDGAFQRVHDEISGGMEAWETNRRWDTILGAGWRDADPATIFDKILSKDIPASVVMEDDHLLAFRDINPMAPVHILVIPKKRVGLTRLDNGTSEHSEILGKLLAAAAKIAKDKSLGFGDGGRVVINIGPDGGQEVPHLHLHVLGGRSFSWPPG
jgi:diadenosine tetraphosphate (Ap4A) HIT family hydrolase/glutathione S-transferase